MRKIREYIEQRERDFAQLDCKLSVEGEMRIIKQLYQEARQNDENNDPNTYHNPVVSAVKTESSAGDGAQPRLDAQRRTQVIVPVRPISDVEDSKEQDAVRHDFGRNNVHA